MNDRLVIRNVWISSWVLSLSLFGDALLYVILPVHANAFGVSMFMVGLLLAVNRIIRIFAYGFWYSEVDFTYDSLLPCTTYDATHTPSTQTPCVRLDAACNPKGTNQVLPNV